MARPHFMAARERRFPIATDVRPNRLLGDWLLDFGLYDAAGHKLQRAYRVSCLPGSDVCERYPARRLQPACLPTGEPVLAVPAH